MSVYKRKDEYGDLWRYRVQITLPDGTKKRIAGTPAINTKDAAEKAERDHVEQALDRAEQYPSGSLLHCVAGIIVERGESCERFWYPVTSAEGHEGQKLTVQWEPEAIRAFCIAQTLHCPEIELENMAYYAEQEIEAIEDGFYADEQEGAA